VTADDCRKTNTMRFRSHANSPEKYLIIIEA